MDPVIPIADLQSIYSVAEVGRALEDGAARRNEGLKSWYDRMRELGGSVTLESATGRGATLAIRLPLTHQETPLARAAG